MLIQIYHRRDIHVTNREELIPTTGKYEGVSKSSQTFPYRLECINLI
jgi:hypothetical protein